MSQKHAELIDYDLDAKNSIDKFPLSDSDAMIYFRGSVDTNGAYATCFTKGKLNGISNLWHAILWKGGDVRDMILNSVICYLSEKPTVKEQFISKLNEL